MSSILWVISDKPRCDGGPDADSGPHSEIGCPAPRGNTTAAKASAVVRR